MTITRNPLSKSIMPQLRRKLCQIVQPYSIPTNDHHLHENIVSDLNHVWIVSQCSHLQPIHPFIRLIHTKSVWPLELSTTSLFRVTIIFLFHCLKETIDPLCGWRLNASSACGHRIVALATVCLLFFFVSDPWHLHVSLPQNRTNTQLDGLAACGKPAGGVLCVVCEKFHGCQDYWNAVLMHYRPSDTTGPGKDKRVTIGGAHVPSSSPNR